MASTYVTIETSGATYTLPNTHWTVESLAQSFASSVPGIASMDGTVEMRGEDKYVTFRPKTGTKG